MSAVFAQANTSPAKPGNGYRNRKADRRHARTMRLARLLKETR